MQLKTDNPKLLSDAINIISEMVLTGLATEGGDFDGKKKIRRILTPDDCYNILKMFD